MTLATDGFTALAKLSTVTAEIAGTHTAMPLQITEGSLGAQASNIFSNTDNGGGDVRFSTDLAGANQIAVDVREWDTSGETCIVRIASDANDSTAEDVYLWGDNTGETQPAASSTYGSESVWTSAYREQFEDESDGTGNSSDALASANSNTMADYGSDEGSLMIDFDPTAWTGYSTTSKALINRSGSGHIFQLQYNRFGSYRVFHFTFKTGFSRPTYEIKSTLTYTSDTDFDQRHLIQISWDIADEVSIRVNRGGSTETVQTMTASTLGYTKAASSTVGVASDSTTWNELIVYNSVKSQDYRDTEVNNQLDPSSFWTAAAVSPPVTSNGQSTVNGGLLGYRIVNGGVN